MPDSPNKISQFWQELIRRKVVRVITVYAAATFVILELLSIIIEPLRLPDWTLQFAIVFLCIGFIIAIILSWIYDIHPEGGVVKTEPADKVKEEEKHPSSRMEIATIISIVVIIGLVLFHITVNKNHLNDLSEQEKSIAVLPFDNMSVDKEYLHMGDAITDEIILELQKIKEFDRVLSRTSTMQYKDIRPIIPEIAEKLGVNYIIEGSIQRHKEDVSIRVQVIRAKHEDHIWGNEYDGKWEDIFSIQDEIALKVANELKTVLSPEELEQIDERPTDNLEAYDMYLKGRYFWKKRTEEGFNQAIVYFSDAIEKDRNYALAYAGLADCYNLIAFYWHISSEDGIQNNFQKGKDAAIKALKIDNTLAEAYSSLAFIKFYHEWDLNGAMKDFERAIQLNPNYGVARTWYSGCLTVLRQHDEAIAEAKRAQELDPFSPIINSNVGWNLYYAGKYDQAIEESLKALNITPDFFPNHFHLGLTYLKKEMFSEAVLEMQKAVMYSEDNLRYKAYLGYVYGATGNQAKAHVILNGLLETSKEGYVPSIVYAIIYIGLNDIDNAISWLEKAYQERSPLLIYLNTNPIYDLLHSDSRYIELLKKMNLPLPNN